MASYEIIAAAEEKNLLEVCEKECPNILEEAMKTVQSLLMLTLRAKDRRALEQKFDRMKNAALQLKKAKELLKQKEIPLTELPQDINEQMANDYKTARNDAYANYRDTYETTEIPETAVKSIKVIVTLASSVHQDALKLIPMLDRYKEMKEEVDTSADTGVLDVSNIALFDDPNATGIGTGTPVSNDDIDDMFSFADDDNEIIGGPMPPQKRKMA
jgi:hypothetical protein